MKRVLAALVAIAVVFAVVPAASAQAQATPSYSSHAIEPEGSAIAVIYGGTEVKMIFGEQHDQLVTLFKAPAGCSLRSLSWTVEAKIVLAMSCSTESKWATGLFALTMNWNWSKSITSAKLIFSLKDQRPIDFGALSPDGQYLAYSDCFTADSCQYGVRSTDGQYADEFNEHQTDKAYPLTWSPDSKMLAMIVSKGDKHQIMAWLPKENDAIYGITPLVTNSASSISFIDAQTLVASSLGGVSNVDVQSGQSYSVHFYAQDIVTKGRQAVYFDVQNQLMVVGDIIAGTPFTCLAQCK